MACRIQNLGKHKLAVDLRGGGVMYVLPNQISPPVREELLYDNVHLAGWEAQGLVRRIDAKMADVLDHEARAAGQPAKAKPATAEKEPAEEESAKAAPDDDDDGNEAGDEGEKAPKRPRRTPK
jgi:uncharacterized membrane protein YukC